MKAYIVQEVSYEYNDEINCMSEGGKPEMIFVKKAKAEEHCLMLNIKMFKGLNLREYCYSIDDILKNGVSDEQFIKKFKNIFGRTIDIDLDNDEGQIPDDATIEQIKKLLELITLRFYTVEECEIEQ
jgi:hypothetical protein